MMKRFVVPARKKPDILVKVFAIVLVLAISIFQGISAGASLEASTSTVSNTNQAPSISGIPATSVTEDNDYAFQPTASDANGDSLTFTISNKPVWAYFNNTTGRLFGTPTNEDVGITKNILITVSDGTATASIGPFNITVNNTNTVSNTNQAPSISGTPATSVDEGNNYRFTPTANDPDGDPLSFSIVNQPVWAAFSSSTGGLSGIPGNSDTGTTSNIRISVSDGIATTTLPAFSITVFGTETQTGSITLNWTAPVARTDSSPLALSEIAGFTVYYGTSTGSYPNRLAVDNGSSTSATITDLPVDTYYLVVTTRDSEGRESDYSREVAKVVN